MEGGRGEQGGNNHKQVIIGRRKLSNQPGKQENLGNFGPVAFQARS